LGVIRKISIGPDYKSGAMHYIVGQSVGKGSHRIHLIMHKEDTNSIKIWIEDDNQEVKLWKEFTATMPISIEYDIDF
jgi:ABC-type ATPase involved in cell division